MKDLEINEIIPDIDGDIEIHVWSEESGSVSVWAPFDKLEKWVVIKQNTRAQVAWFHSMALLTQMLSGLNANVAKS